MQRKLASRLCFGLVLTAIILFAAIRYRLRSMPLERDEGEYAYAGQLMLQGISPYDLVYSMKLPGTYAAYALILTAFGQTPAGIHFGLILVNAATTLLIFFLATRLFDEVAGTVAAISYALLSTSPSVLGLAAHATHFVVFAALAGILVLLSAIESNKLWLFFASGCLLGAAFMMKQPGILFLLFAIVYVLKLKLRSPIDWKSLGSTLGLLILGSLLPLACMSLFILKTGAFHNFWFWAFAYAAQYTSEVPPSVALALFGRAVSVSIQPVWLMWAIAATGLAAFLWCSRARSQAFFLVSLLLASAAAVCPGFYFREHYFILMLPAVSLLAGVSVSCATDKLSHWRNSNALSAVPIVVFLIAASYTVFQQRDFLFRMDPVAACRSLYPANPFPEAISIAKFIESHTSPASRIAVVGSEPEIYFYSHRHSATGYIYTYPLVENQKYAGEMQSQMIAEIEAAQPEYLIYVDVPASWLPKPGANLYIFTWLKGYLQDHYKLVGVDRSIRREAQLPEIINIDRPLSTLNIYVFKQR